MVSGEKFSRLGITNKYQHYPLPGFRYPAGEHSTTFACGSDRLIPLIRGSHYQHNPLGKNIAMPH